MRQSLVFLTFLWIPFFGFGQIDSLKSELRSKKITEFQKMKIYNALSAAYGTEQLDSSSVYADLAYDLAKKVKNPEGLAIALIRKSFILENVGKNDKAIQNLEQAKIIAQKNKLKITEAEIYYAMGRAYKKELEKALYHYDKSILISEKLGLKDLVLRNKIRISRILFHQKRHQELAELYNEILPELQKRNDIDGLAETYTYMSLAFRDLDEKAKSLLYAEKALHLVEKSTNKQLNAFVYGAIGSGVTNYFESFEKAEPLVRKGQEIATEINNPSLIKDNQKRLGILYFSNYEDEKATAIFDKLLVNSDDPDLYKFKGYLLAVKNKHKEAINYLEKAYKLYEKENAFIQQNIVLNDIIRYKLKLLGDTELAHDFVVLDSLAKIIHNTENKNQFFDLETKYRTAEKETEIQKKELELAKSNNRMLLITGIAIFFLSAGAFSFWFMRNKQKRKELEHSHDLLELQNSINAMELANLNNQLNPHEIKNLITSIAPELITKAPEAYKKMIKLLNVTRASLSNKLTEPLEIQLTQAEDFLQLQQSISPHHWKYEIENEVEGLEIELPRLLLKNLAENAVKHGMKSIIENGIIQIGLTRENNYLKINVIDNGKGFEGKQNAESTGIGFSTYQKLFNFANANNEQKATLKLQRKEGWTKAELLLPLHYNY